MCVEMIVCLWGVDMNELTMYVIVALFSAAWVVYFGCGLVKLWFRLEKYPIIGKIMNNLGIDYEWTGLLLLLITGFSGILTLVCYDIGVLHIAVFSILSILVIIFAPRFIIDVCRGLKYNAKTGELERIKELERKK